MKLRRPVMGDEEAQAAILGLKVLVRRGMLAHEDEDKIRHAIEALECAPVVDGAKSELDPAARELGAFARKSDTSRAGALANYPKSGTQRSRILAQILAAADGMTREELAARLQLGDNSVRPRVRELLDGGWVAVLVREGDPVTRRTALGNQSEVLVATAKARARRQAQGSFRGTPVTA